MSDDATTDDATTDDAGAADYRQVSFVVLAALALILAAAFAPGMAGQNGSGDGSGNGDSETVEPSGDPGDEPTVGFDWRRLLELLNLDGGPQEPSEPACTITLDRDPIPGDRVTATIRYEGEPLTDTPVWFNDRRVGETDRNGRVTGTVPYAERLVIRVGAAGEATCRAETATSPSTTVLHGAGDRQLNGDRQPHERVAPAPNASPRPAGTVPLASAASTAATLAADSAPAATSSPLLSTLRVQDESSNATGTYEVTGEVEIDVRGDPYPGETITVEAAIEGVPMRRATVSVDGTTVGETDADGTATVTVPDDGTKTFELAVARGDFAGTTTVHVLVLEARFAPDGLAPIPGSDGAITATINGTPVAGADVAVDGEDVGTTDPDGRLPVRMPLDPTTTVTVSTDRQTATVSLLGQYGPIASVIALVVAGLAALSYRGYGRSGPVAVVGTTVVVFAVLVVEAFYGPRAGLVALAVAALFGLGIGLWRAGAGRPRVRNPISIRDVLDRLETWVVETALGVVSRVEALLEWAWSQLGVLRAWLRTLPRSARGLGGRVAAWVRRLPGRARAQFRKLLEAVRTVPSRAAAVGVAAVALIAGGYAVDGVRGAIVAAVAFAAVGLVARRVGETEPESTVTEDEPESASAEPTATVSADEPRSFRELWRAFARRVAPRRWRTRTPGEIERRALAKDYPREPVRELTALFREVEYGDRPRSSGHRDRAADAYEAIERARGRDGDPDRSGDSESPSAATADTATEENP